MGRERNIVVVFDLDDTLYKEVDFLWSGFCAIEHELQGRTCIECGLAQRMREWWRQGENAFELVAKECNGAISVAQCLEIYRNHKPCIALRDDARLLLDSLKHHGAVMGVITDGRVVTQMNKIEALGLLNYINKEDIVVSEAFGSEKPCVDNYNYFVQRYLDAVFYYVGDNVKKDFVAPNQLGWQSICLLNDGRNIHAQTLEMSDEAKPTFSVASLSDIVTLIFVAAE